MFFPIWQIAAGAVAFIILLCGICFAVIGRLGSADADEAGEAKAADEIAEQSKAPSERYH